MQEAEDLIDTKEVAEQIQRETRQIGRRTEAGEPSIRRCRICKNPGHNTRTCQLTLEVSEDGDSKQF